MKTAFMFSGQGSEKVGMCKDLYEEYESVRGKFATASKRLGFDLSKVVFEDETLIKNTEYAQPALVTTSISILEILTQENIKPDYVLGLSLGEYSAFIASGALSFEETVKLVNTRGKLMNEAFVGRECGMLAVLNADIEDIKEVVKIASEKGVVEIANYNTGKQIVISGELVALEVAKELFKEKKIKSLPLNVKGAFHTSLLENASNKLEVELKNLNIENIEIPVVTNLTANVVTNKDEIVEILKNQLKSSVLFEQSVLKLIDLGVTRFVEVGTGKTLSSFVKKINSDVEVITIEDVTTLKNALEILK